LNERIVLLQCLLRTILLLEILLKVLFGIVLSVNNHKSLLILVSNSILVVILFA